MAKRKRRMKPTTDNQAGSPRQYALLQQQILAVVANYTKATIERLKDDSMTATERIVDCYIGIVAGFTSNISKHEKIFPCKRGCWHCCTMRVEITPIEALSIAAILSVEDFKRLEEAYENMRRSGGQISYWKNAAPKCPLLVGDDCAIHGFRPLACRGHFSFDAKSCRADWQSRNRGGESKKTPYSPEIRIVTGAYSAIALQAIKDMGLPATYMLEMITALIVAYRTENAAERFLAGEDIFVQTSAYKDPAAIDALTDEIGEWAKAAYGVDLG